MISAKEKKVMQERGCDLSRSVSEILHRVAREGLLNG